MRARRGWASALAILASEVSPGGRVRLLPDGVDELVGMVAASVAVRAVTPSAKSANAPTRMLSTDLPRSIEESDETDFTPRSCTPGQTLFTMLLPKRSASLTDPPKSDPCRPPART